MIHRILITGLLLFVVALVNSAGAAETDVTAKTNDGKEAEQAKVIFAKIKSLSGEWEREGTAALLRCG